MIVVINELEKYRKFNPIKLNLVLKKEENIPIDLAPEGWTIYYDKQL